MRDFVEVVYKYFNIIKLLIRSLVIKSGFFMRKEEYIELVKDLIVKLNVMLEEVCFGKKVLLIGILVDFKDILDILEDNNILVVVDDLV